MTMNELYEKQKEIQAEMGIGVGTENIIQWYNALSAVSVEIGEALSEDTRWKRLVNGNVKKAYINREGVIGEIADIYLYLFNACIFYGISYETLVDAICTKQNKNRKRLLQVK